jgi:TrmH family RNA methyltransferase
MMNSEQATFPQLSKNHLAELKKLHQKKFRHLEGRTLAEGMNLIEQLHANGINPLQLITDQSEMVQKLFRTYRCEVLLAKPHEIGQLAETETPQPLIGVYFIPEPVIKQYDTALYLDGIRDPGNLGTVFRTASAFGIDAIFLSADCCEVWSPKVIRASLGSVFWLPSITADSAWLKEQKAEKAGLVMDGSILLKDFVPDKTLPLILVIGSEGSGISTEIAELLTVTLSIPISDRMESLNASVAAAIAMYETCVRKSG